jgi:hypothetical protein
METWPALQVPIRVKSQDLQKNPHHLGKIRNLASFQIHSLHERNFSMRMFYHFFIKVNGSGQEMHEIL